MRVNATLIPAAAPAASAATRTPTLSSTPTSFGVQLASSISESGLGSGHFQKLSAPAEGSDSKSRASTTPSLTVISNRSLNSPSPVSKSAAKSDGKSDVEPASNPVVISPSALVPIPSSSTSLPAGTPVVARFERSAFTAPVPNPADLSTNSQPLGPQLTANLKGVPPPPPFAQPTVISTPSVTDGTPSSSAATTASSVQCQTRPTATSFDSISATSRPALLLMPNVSEDLGVVPPVNAGAPNATATSAVPIEAGRKSTELAPAIVEAVSDAAPSFPNFATQLFTTSAEPSTPSASVSGAPALPAGTPLRIADPSFDPNHSMDPSIVSSSGNPSADPVSDQACGIFLRQPSTPPPAVAPNPTAVPALLQAPIPQSPAKENNFVLLTEPGSVELPADRSSTGSKASTSTPGIYGVENSTPIIASAVIAAAVISAAIRPGAAQSAPSRASAVSNSATAPNVYADPNPAVQSASSPETGSGAANGHLTSDNAVDKVLSATAPVPGPLAESEAMAAPSSEGADNAMPGLLSPPALSTVAAMPASTIADKKPSPTISPNATSVPAGPSSTGSLSANSSSGNSSSAISSSGVLVALAAGKDSSGTVSAPILLIPGAGPAAGTVSAPELPQAHQMLDSAPAAPLPQPPAPIVPGSPADVQMNEQMNAQMHVGIRTDVFGAVEIHTVVQQSQVGITVHADRDIVRWFSSEVPGLESGLNKSHLNLTAVDFDSGRSGVQTATSFQHGQPRQSFSQTPGSSAALPGSASPEPDLASESTADGILPPDLAVGTGRNHVSIHV